MSIFDIFRKKETKQDPTFRSIILTTLGSAIWTKKDIAKFTEAGYMNCCTVFACVREITDAAAGIPWILSKKAMSKTTKKERIEDHKLLDIMTRPNPRDSGVAFIRNTLAFFLISGNSYLIRVGPERGEPKELYYMRPDRVKIVPGTAIEPIRGYEYRASWKSQIFKFNKVLHLRDFHPLDDWYGLSRIEVAAKEVDTSSMAREWNMKLLQNDCRPPGAFRTEGSLSEEQYRRLKEDIKEHQGYENAGKPLLLEAGLDWVDFTISPRDMDYLNSDKINSRKICSVYNVAPELIGDSENKTYSNYKEARKALYLETVMPLLDYLQSELNNWLTPAFGERLILEYDKDSIEAIREELDAVYNRQEKAWWRTLNEKRLATGDDEVPGGDVIFIPANFIPLTDISGNREEE